MPLSDWRRRHALPGVSDAVSRIEPAYEWPADRDSGARDSLRLAGPGLSPVVLREKTPRLRLVCAEGQRLVERRHRRHGRSHEEERSRHQIPLVALYTRTRQQACTERTVRPI